MKGLILALVVGHSCAQATAAPLVYRAAQHCLASQAAKPCIARMQGHADALTSLNAQTLVVGGRAFAQQGHQLALLLTQTESRPAANGRGFCGAGQELAISLWLIDQPKALARQVDVLKLASCLENIDTAQPTKELTVSLAAAKKPEQWRIEWLTHPVYGPGMHSVIVRGLKLVVEPMRQEGPH